MSCSSDPVVSRAGRQLIALLLLVAAAIVAAGIFVLILTGGAAAEEVGNETVTVDNSTGELYVSVTFSSTVDDANATADVAITAPDGTEFASGTISGTAGNVTTEEFAVNDSDATGNYSVVVTADAGAVDSTTIDTFEESSSSSGGGAGLLEGNGAGAVLVAIVVAVLAAVGLARRADR